MELSDWIVQRCSYAEPVLWQLQIHAIEQETQLLALSPKANFLD
jgi:hypothetical protein